MTKWLFLVVLVVAGGVLGFLYVNLDKVEVPLNISDSDTAANEVVVTHAFKDGAHRFSGEFKLPHSCYSTDAITVIDPKKINALIIQIATRDRSLEWSPCAIYTTRYEFIVIADEPENISFTLEIGGKQQRISVKEVSWESSSGAIIRTL